MKWLYFLVTIIVLILLRALYYYLKLRALKSYQTKYVSFLRNEYNDFVGDSPQVLELFHQAGIQPKNVTIYEKMPNGSYGHATVNVFDNMSNTTSDSIIEMMKISFMQSAGVYKNRIKQSYSLMFWMDFVINLPKHLLSFLGVLPDSIVSKILIVLYWMLGIYFGFKSFDLDLIGLLKK